LISSPTPDALAHAARLLRSGQLVAFPTETVYGLGADAGNEDAVRAIFAAKGRPADHPVIVHVRDAREAATWARAMPRGARLLADAFWPGPLTIIVPRAPHVSDAVTGGQDSVGLRVPSHAIAQALLQAFAQAGGRGIAAPSANRFGRISPTTARHVRDDLGPSVSMIVDGGACEVGIESTIVAFVDDEPQLMRPGGIAEAALVRVLGATLAAPRRDAPRASGTLASHYAPRTPSRLVSADALSSNSSVAVLAHSVRAKSARWIVAPAEAIAYAHDLYANLRALDAMGASEILIEDVPHGDEWNAVRDRLVRATHGDEDDRD
jgi:L-threonylcarbamoyladenylate synthase